MKFYQVATGDKIYYVLSTGNEAEVKVLFEMRLDWLAVKHIAEIKDRTKIEDIINSPDIYIRVL